MNFTVILREKVYLKEEPKYNPYFYSRIETRIHSDRGYYNCDSVFMTFSKIFGLT